MLRAQDQGFLQNARGCRNVAAVEGSLRLGVQVVRLLPIFLLARFGFAKLQFSAAPLLFPGVRR
ncbi:MAG TPA: hypothetical protein VMQ86_08315 [Bryobacteraceae bacterium]|jgi:hypothetical protein|nr:hypothetical protein [Bryobacteraceae bacterium]